MFGRTPAEAAQRFLDLTQHTTACVTDSVVGIGGGYFPAPVPHLLTFADNRLVRLRGPEPLQWFITQCYRIIPTTGDAPDAWRVEVVSYVYSIYDHAEREILAYHWHPEGRSFIAFPHLHLESGSGVTRPRLLGAHLPTGQVALQDVVRCLIEELGVTPRRPDWRAIVAAPA